MDDAEAMVSVTAEGWRQAYADFVRREVLATLPIDRWGHEIRVGLRRPVGDAFTYVAEIDGEFAGYCYVAAPTKDPAFGPEVAELGAMYIDPGHWREGVGRELMDSALGRLSGMPYEAAILWTFEENLPAIAFYERHGWTKDGARRIHVRSGEPAIRMRRPLR